MSDVVRFTLLGLGPGGIYALLAMGVVLVYRGSGVVNFGAGGFALVGSAIYYELHVRLGTPLTILIAVASTAILGVVVQLAILYPMRASSPLARVVATLGVTAALEFGAKWIYGTRSRFVESFLPSDGVQIGDVVVGADRLYILGLTALVTLVLWTSYRYATFGIATTAVAENPRATSCLGWSPTRIAAVNWALGGALAGLAGVLLVPILGFAPTTFTLLIVPALAVAVVARFRSFPIALAGGLVIGILESLGTLVSTEHPGKLLGVIPTFGLASSVPFFVIIIVMVARGRALPLRGELTDRLPRLGTGVPRWPVLAVVIVLVGASVVALSTSWVSSVSISATVALVGISVVVVTGYAGQLSLAQFALAGIGALVSSRLADAGGLPFLLSGIIGVVVAVGVGLIVALPAVRVRGVNLAVVTLALAVVISSAVLSNTDWNGGAIRGTRVPDPTVFGVNVQSVKHPERWAFVCIAVLILACLVVSNMRRGRSGRRLIAVRDNERAAASLGVNVFIAKLYAFAVGAALAGMGGVLLAFRNTSVDFSQFTPFRSIEILLLSVIGGIGFIGGGIVAGTAVLGGVAEHIIGNIASVGDGFRFILSLMFLRAIVGYPDGFTEHFSRNVVQRLARLVNRLRHRGQTAQGIEARRSPVEPVEPMQLEVRDLLVQFGGVRAVDGVSFNVAPGEVFGLIGPNGAGKTTVVDALTGFLRQYRGEVRLNGERIDGLTASQRATSGLTRSFQSLELFEDLSVADNLRIAADDGRGVHLFKDLMYPRTQRLGGTAATVIDEFELGEVLDRLPSELSYAQRRTVAIARAVATTPSVLLLDEPAAGLDATARVELEHLIRRLAEDWKMAVLLIEHDVAMVMRTCDRVMALNFGRTIAAGLPDEVRRHPDVIAAYLGTDDEQSQHGQVSADANEPMVNQ
jgi:ABC-type branched-subunit amino acid transport system ATPase component/branched-subunit amino acid ABC-type transport system permease component